MKDLLIFTKALSAYEPNRFYQEALKMGLKAEIVVYSDLDFSLSKGKTFVQNKGKILEAPRMVVFRAAGGEDFYIPQRDYLISYFEQKGSKVLNAETYKRWSRLDKITQHFEFAKAKLPVIDSLIFGSNERLLKYNFDFPSIIKYNLSSQGRDVFKLKRKGNVRRIIRKGYFARTMLLQPFLHVGEDLRIIVIDKKILGAMKRIAKKGKYLTNYSQGGLIEEYDLKDDQKAQEIVKKTVEHFKLDYVGIDLMKSDDGEWKVLEINRACQFKGFETATGLNVPKKVIEFLNS